MWKISLETKKLEEELREWNEKVAQMTAETGEAAIQKLHEEIKECKSILKCGVCFDRPKEVGFSSLTRHFYFLYI